MTFVLSHKSLGLPSTRWIGEFQRTKIWANVGTAPTRYNSDASTASPEYEPDTANSGSDATEHGSAATRFQGK